MQDYSQSAVSQKFEKVANQLSLAEGYAFADHINLSDEEECARWALIKVCCEFVRSATEHGVLDKKSLEDFLAGRRGL